jgi:hypothetical protein
METPQGIPKARSAGPLVRWSAGPLVRGHSLAKPNPVALSIGGSLLSHLPSRDRRH